VRSFELDLWDENTEAVEKIGNADVNSVFEETVPVTAKKPDPSADRESREKWIIDKYVHKKFVKRLPRPAPPSPSLSSSTSSISSSRSHRSHFREPSANLADKLPPGFSVSSAEPRPRTPELIPTSHIGSNVFAKRMPYSPGLRTIDSRRGSLNAILEAPYRVPVRRNSLHPRIM
jgi:hypothetical protein